MADFNWPVIIINFEHGHKLIIRVSYFLPFCPFSLIIWTHCLASRLMMTSIVSLLPNPKFANVYYVISTRNTTLLLLLDFTYSDGELPEIRPRFPTAEKQSCHHSILVGSPKKLAFSW